MWPYGANWGSRLQGLANKAPARIPPKAQREVRWGDPMTLEAGVTPFSLPGCWYGTCITLGKALPRVAIQAYPGGDNLKEQIMRWGSEDERPQDNHGDVVSHRLIHQYFPHAAEIREEPLAVESLLHLMVQGRLYQNMLYMPGKEKELALGFLLTSGVIESLEDVAELALVPGTPERPFLAVEVSLTGPQPEALRDMPVRLAEAVLANLPEASERVTARAFAAPAPPQKLRAEQLRALVEQLPTYQQLYSLTRATHAILLADPHTGTIITGAEDVGRHNAFDKVIGRALLDHLPLHDKVVVLSGRASFEMVLKAARGGLPVMAAVSAPTLLAVRLAEAQGITLATSIRNHTVKVYSHPERLTGP